MNSKHERVWEHWLKKLLHELPNTKHFHIQITIRWILFLMKIDAFLNNFQQSFIINFLLTQN